MKRSFFMLAACGGATHVVAPRTDARIGEGMVTAGRSGRYAVGDLDGTHTSVTCQIASVTAIAFERAP